MKTDDIARICYEATRAYSHTVFDYGYKPWHDSDPSTMNTVIDCVEFLLKNPKATPEDFHNNWVTHKRKSGWKWGGRRSTDAKEHPNLLDYKDLSEEQKIKSKLFVAVMRAIANEPKS